MLAGIAALTEQIAADRADVHNVYGVAVSPGGNRVAQDMISRVLAPAPAVWRAMGTIDASGLELREPYARFDARRQLDIEIGPDHEPPGCLCGQVIQGKADPPECGLFAGECTPLTPVGPCMVSSEGTCAAWYKYSRTDTPSAQVTQQ
jgi:hydrogenase expression/formation protein HypD